MSAEDSDYKVQNPNIPALIGEIEVCRYAPDTPEHKQVVKLKTLWQDQPVVIQFMRRFGCSICRHAAVRLCSEIAEPLAQNNVKLIGVGLEWFGIEEYVEGKYWTGDLYVDDGKKVYKALNLRSLGLLNGFGMLDRRVYEADSAAKKAGVTGNLKGDGFQLGATFVIKKGGELTLEFRQQSYVHHPEPTRILQALDLDPQLAKHNPNLVHQVPECTDVCKM